MEKNPTGNCWTRDAYYRNAINLTTNLGKEMQRQQEEVDEARFVFEEQSIEEKAALEKRLKSRAANQKRRMKAISVLQEEEQREKREREALAGDVEERKKALEIELKAKYPLEFLDDDVKMSLTSVMLLPLILHYLRIVVEDRLLPSPPLYKTGKDGSGKSSTAPKRFRGTEDDGDSLVKREEDGEIEEERVRVKLEEVAQQTEVRPRLGAIQEPDGFGAFLVPHETGVAPPNELPFFSSRNGLNHSVFPARPKTSKETESGCTFIDECASSKTALLWIEENIVRSISEEETAARAKEARLKEQARLLTQMDTIPFKQLNQFRETHCEALLFAPTTPAECEAQRKEEEKKTASALRRLGEQLTVTRGYLRRLDSEKTPPKKGGNTDPPVLEAPPPFTTLQEDLRAQRSQRIEQHLTQEASFIDDANRTLYTDGRWETVDLSLPVATTTTPYDPAWMEGEAQTYAWPSELEERIGHVLYASMDNNFGGKKRAQKVSKNHNGKNVGFRTNTIFWRPLQISKKELRASLVEGEEDTGTLPSSSQWDGIMEKQRDERLTPRCPKLPKHLEFALLYINGRGEFLSRSAELSSS